MSNRAHCLGVCKNALHSQFLLFMFHSQLIFSQNKPYQLKSLFNLEHLQSISTLVACIQVSFLVNVQWCRSSVKLPRFLPTGANLILEIPLLVKHCNSSHTCANIHHVVRVNGNRCGCYEREVRERISSWTTKHKKQISFTSEHTNGVVF